MQLRNRRPLGDISNREGEDASQSQSKPPAKRQRRSLDPAAAADVTASAPSVSSEARTDVPPVAPAVEVPVVAAPSAAAPQAPLVAPPAPAAAAMAPAPVQTRRRNPAPELCLDILDDMSQRWRSLELQYSPTAYMSSQYDITYRMRTILVDWLVEVHYKFRLHGASLWLTVNLLDRYLQRTSIPRERLQLVGVASLLIASKFDEVSPPEVTECVNITDNSYTKRELLNMEYNILETLSFQVCVPTGFNFMNRYLSLINADDTTRHLAFFYAERNLQEQHMLHVTPTTLVSAALFAALWQRASTSRSPEDPALTPASVWPDVLARETQFSAENLVTLARSLVANVAMEPVTTSQRRLVAARKKYTQELYLNVAALPLPAIPGGEEQPPATAAASNANAVTGKAAPSA